jgi:hypothetical protein
MTAIGADQKIYGLIAKTTNAIKKYDSFRKALHAAKCFYEYSKNQNCITLFIFVSNLLL